MKYRIGIDLGTNSLGWAAIQLSEKLEPQQLMDMGVRIFSDARNPKDKSSNAAQRRGPRGMRRNWDRKLARGRSMMHALVEAGLLPEEKSKRKKLEALDPWILRARALEEELSPYEIGRALFHLQQRRGFKSNRKTDGEGDGAMFDAIEKARRMMDAQNARTLGELFGRPRLEQLQANQSAASGKGKPMPQARVKARSEGSKMAYDYYPDRAMILDEFEKIWDAQANYHSDVLTDEAHDKLRHVIEHQRPLKPQKAGKCTFLPEEPRAPKALPTAQYARILQEVNALKVGATGEVSQILSPKQRQTVIDYLMTPSSKTGKRTFKSIRKQLGLPESQKFSHESRKRDHLMGDSTAAKLMQDDSWGKDWLSLPRKTQDEIVIKLLETEQEAELIAWLSKEHNVETEQAKNIARTRLPDAHGKLSKAALDRIVPHMETGLRYDDAAKAEFRDHRAMGDGVIHEDELPYYGEILSRHTAFEKDVPENDEEKFGRVANPTVHVALNELRKVINDLIRRWGPPEQVVLELTRDLPLSDRGLRDLEARQTKNQKANEERNKWLESQGHATNYENRLKLRLYEEALDVFDGVAVCVFTGKTIAKTEVFTDAVEVEHILPLSKTLDDSFANKVLCLREANRVKGNKSPAKAFDHSPEGYDWEELGQRAAQLPASKRWRFDPDAMQQWEARGGNFLARQLNDTRYISRLGKTFVEALFGGQGMSGQKRQVWVVPGRLTSDLRHYAGFNNLVGLTGGNQKDRTDHRHHAVDALVVALTDQAMVKRASDLESRKDQVKHSEIMQAMAEPLKRYRKSAEDRLSKLIISHKPDHGFQDSMHNDTAYGIVEEGDKKNQALLVTRKPLDALSANDLHKIVDPLLQARLKEDSQGLTGKDFTTALVQSGKSMSPPVYSVRIHTPMKPTSFVTIRHGEEDEHVKAYKGDGNYCYDIFMGHKGKWAGEVITTYQAYQMAQDDPKWWRKPVGREGQPLIMRIRKGDMLEIETGGDIRRIVVVYKFSAGKVNMAEHHEADASARIRAKELLGFQMSPGSLGQSNAIKVTVSPSGKIRRHKSGSA
ncbi:type II CRISPR RNA-guided endonuclease Cas9 [Litorimonas sp.]|uniref:type II CRISPR RNA-guided endonuclease Cas9 n=1 Tax=Litorimonas sp. TaxID=1892381 RepID=UPI003A8AE019